MREDGSGLAGKHAKLSRCHCNTMQRGLLHILWIIFTHCLNVETNILTYCSLKTFAWYLVFHLRIQNCANILELEKTYVDLQIACGLETLLCPHLQINLKYCGHTWPSMNSGEREILPESLHCEWLTWAAAAQTETCEGLIWEHLVISWHVFLHFHMVEEILHKIKCHFNHLSVFRK